MIIRIDKWKNLMNFCFIWLLFCQKKFFGFIQKHKILLYRLNNFFQINTTDIMWTILELSQKK